MAPSTDLQTWGYVNAREWRASKRQAGWRGGDAGPVCDAGTGQTAHRGVGVPPATSAGGTPRSETGVRVWEEGCATGNGNKMIDKKLPVAQ